MAGCTIMRLLPKSLVLNKSITISRHRLLNGPFTVHRRADYVQQGIAADGALEAVHDCSSFDAVGSCKQSWASHGRG